MMKELKEEKELNIKINELREKISQSVKRNKFESILFSGGLDTTILMYENLKENSDTIAVNVRLENFGEDFKFARELSKILNFKIYEISIKIEEAISVIPEVIKILKTFDPAIPNDLPVYFGLKFIKELKIKNFATGDGSDELFCGYEYMRKIKNLEKYVEELSKSMEFNSNKICKFFNLEIKQPYIDKQIINFALSIPADLKIRKEKNKVYGKWILRKAYENFLPKKFVWQDKRPLEVGSGFENLRKILESKISDEEFKEKKKKYKIKFISKEHLYYYEIYKEVVGEIPEPKENEKRCIYCGAGINLNSNHCKICGGNF